MRTSPQKREGPFTEDYIFSSSEKYDCSKHVIFFPLVPCTASQDILSKYLMSEKREKYLPRLQRERHLLNVRPNVQRYREVKFRRSNETQFHKKSNSFVIFCRTKEFIRAFRPSGLSSARVRVKTRVRINICGLNEFNGFIYDEFKWYILEHSECIILIYALRVQGPCIINISDRNRESETRLTTATWPTAILNRYYRSPSEIWTL